MNPEDFIRIMQGGSFEQNNTKTPVEKLDLFIDRCCNERDETLYTLGQRIAYKLNASPMLSFEEIRIYPQVLRRIEELLEKGEV